MDQLKKFNRKPASRGVPQLLCWALGMGISAASWAAPPIASALGSKPQASLAEQPANDRLAALKTRLAKQYPDVRHVSIDDYLSQHPKAVLVDVRAAQEYAVSRIPGAVHIEDRAELLRFARAHADAQLILYCSVGARSAEAARFLQNQAQDQNQSQDQNKDQQIGKVANLAGSIFEWANEQRPLENAAGPTTEVHPFNAWWGWRYLN